MAKFNGVVVLQLKEMNLNSKEELSDALYGAILTIADQVTKFDGTPKDVAVSGTVNTGPTGTVTGATGSVTVGGNNGSVTVQGGVNSSGQPTGGSVTGTYHF